MNSTYSPFTSSPQAVIGAGAAGLVAARELLREGHSVSVFEQSGSVGGVWAYDPAVEDDDMLGSSPGRTRVRMEGRGEGAGR
eukprot:350242-Chlamydomonas_euryale.AAC.2